LPGAEAAIREPRRAALGMCWRLFDGQLAAIPDSVRGSFLDFEWPVIERMLGRGIHSPMTSSVGRSFDAVAALLGLVDIADFDAEGPIKLEELAADHPVEAYPMEIVEAADAGLLIADWREALRSLLADLEAGRDPAHVAAAFHETVAEVICVVARRIGIPDVLLTGGVFQNARLSTRANALLREAGFRVHTHTRVPPNDGALALGQVFAAQPESASRAH